MYLPIVENFCKQDSAKFIACFARDLHGVMKQTGMGCIRLYGVEND